MNIIKIWSSWGRQFFNNKLHQHKISRKISSISKMKIIMIVAIWSFLPYSKVIYFLNIKIFFKAQSLNCTLGAKTYITGRNEDALTKTSLELGHMAIPVVCDHADDVAIKALFDRISLENDNQLDFLVNNCFAAGKILLKQEGETDCTKFWENEPELWDQVRQLFLQSQLFCRELVNSLICQNGLLKVVRRWTTKTTNPFLRFRLISQKKSFSWRKMVIFVIFCETWRTRLNPFLSFAWNDF